MGTLTGMKTDNKDGRGVNLVRATWEASHGVGDVMLRKAKGKAGEMI